MADTVTDRAAWRDAVWASEYLPAAAKAVAETYARNAAGPDCQAAVPGGRLMVQAGISRLARLAEAVFRLVADGWLTAVERPPGGPTVFRLTLPARPAKPVPAVTGRGCRSSSRRPGAGQCTLFDWPDHGLPTTNPYQPARPAQQPAKPIPWRELAACRGEDRDRFFGTPDRYGIDRHATSELDAAKAVCQRCPVREECLAEALDSGPDLYGVWGGTTKTERERLTRPIRRVKCPVCGGTPLPDGSVVQVCAGCGHSWITLNPTAQARASAA